MGGRPPQSFIYELFLDERGEKISKSQRQRPRRRGLADVRAGGEPGAVHVPEAEDGEAAALRRHSEDRRRVSRPSAPLSGAAAPAQLENPVWHIHGGEPPREGTDLRFSALLNLVGVCHSEDKAVLWHFVSRYWPSAAPETAPMVDRLIEHAIAYYRDFVKPALRYRRPTAEEAAALDDLARELEALAAGSRCRGAADDRLRGRQAARLLPDLKAWFRALYEILLGQSEGPRMGSFIALYGVPETVALIRRAIAGENLANALPA